jgi:hypothetical protein
MPDEVVTMVTINNEWYKANHDMSFLTPEQQGYFLFGLMAVFVIGLVIYFYWKDKQDGIK